MNKKSDDFLSAISQAGIPEIIKEYAEVGIDSQIPDKIIKDIPILGTIFSIFKISESIKDFLFAKKISIFLKELYESTNEKERKELADKIRKDDKYATKIGEKLFYLIEKADDNEKPLLMAKAFCAYLKEKINLEELNRIIFGIEKMLMINKNYFNQFASRDKNKIKKIPYYATHNLAEAGFINITTGWDDLLSEINEIGEKFNNFVLH